MIPALISNGHLPPLDYLWLTFLVLACVIGSAALGVMVRLGWHRRLRGLHGTG